MSQQQTLQQRRAAHAWKQVEDLSSAKHKDDYGGLVRGLPALVQGNGLATTLAFLKAKGKFDKKKGEPEHEDVYNHLSNWLKAWAKEHLSQEFTDLLVWTTQIESTTYRQVTAETLAYLNWIKRFAEAKGFNSDKRDNK